jgi:hypothetical protein
MTRPGRLVGDTALALALALGLLTWMVVATSTGSVFTGVTTNPGNSFAAAPQFCRGASPVWLTGFESGVISKAGATANPAASLVNTITGTVSIVEVSRSGNYSLRVSKSSSADFVAKSNLGGGTVITMRLAIRFSVLPTADQAELLKIDIGTGGDAVLGFNFAAKKFTVGFAGGTAQSGPASALVDALWYRIDLRVNVAADPHVIDWQVDGEPMPQASAAGGADTFAGTVNLGSTVSGDGFGALYDDVLVSLAAADYPVGDGRILSLVPDTYLGKNDFTPAYLKDDTGTDLSAASHQLLDETPMNNTTDYVRQDIGSATDYWAEFGFDDVTRASCINGVSAVVALHSAGTVANSVRTAILTDGNERLVHSGDSVATAAGQYRSAIIASADGSWDAAELTAVTARIGYYRVGGSVPYWDGLRLEYDQAPNAASVYANVVLADNPAGYWRLGEAVSAGTAAASAGAATGTYINSPGRGVGGAVGDADAAVSLDGAARYVAFGNIHDFAGTASFTAEAWIRPTTNALAEPTGFSVFSTSSLSDGSGGWSMRYTCNSCGPANKLRVDRGVLSHGTATLSDYRWYHVVMTYDGIDLRSYVNGALQATQPTAVAVVGNADPLVVGRHYSTSTLVPVYLDARVDEAAIYTSALDPTRIQAHYNAGRP